MRDHSTDLAGALKQNLPLVYQSINISVLNSVPAHVTRVLDIGCGGGDFGAALKARSNCSVVGVTFSAAEAQLARTRLDAVEIADLNQIEPAFLGRYDCIVCCHVLEHLYDPQRLLRALARDCLTSDGLLIVALPNVLHWKQRLMFLLGRFRYTEGGLMDRTHYRFYDWLTSAMLLKGSDFQILSKRADGILPLSRHFGPMSRTLNRIALNIFPGLFGWQFILCAKKSPQLSVESFA